MARHSPKRILKNIGGCIYGCFTVPVACFGVGCLIWDVLVTKPRRGKKERRALENVKAIPFAGLASNRRPLTPNRNASKTTGFGGSRSIKTIPQLECQLLSLPYELRLMIYDYLLPGSHLSLLSFPISSPVRRRRKPDQPPQMLLSGYPCSSQCQSLSKPGFCHPSCILPTLQGVVPLLQTCHQLYAEFLPYLYQKYTFNMWFFDHPVSSFWNHGRFDVLNKLDVLFTIYASPFDLSTSEHPSAREWKTNWLTIASLPNLKQLQVWIQAGEARELNPWMLEEENWTAWREKQICVMPRMVKNVKGLDGKGTDKWNLWLGWYGVDGCMVDENEDYTRDLPFVVERYEP